MKKYKLGGAEAFETGIVFHSKKHKGYLTYAESDGYNITVSYMKRKDFFSTKKKNSTLKKVIFTLGFIVILILNFNLAIKISCIYFVISNILFFRNYAKNFLFGRKKEIFKFHSAEHMVYNAYKKLKRVPTLEEIKLFSRYNKNCGVTYRFCLVLTAIFTFIFSFIFNNETSIYYSCITYLIIDFMRNINCFNFVQFFYTEKPTDANLQLAIEGMKFGLEKEKIPKCKWGSKNLVYCFANND